MLSNYFLSVRNTVSSTEPVFIPLKLFYFLGFSKVHIDEDFLSRKKQMLNKQ